MEKNSKPKRKFKKIKVGYIFASVIIIAFILLVLKLILPSSGVNKYGDRLDGIEKYRFSDKAKNKVIDNIKGKEQVESCKIDVQGKIINIIYTVNKDTSIDDAKNIANESLAELSDKIKSYYDIQFMINKKDEEGRKETKTVDDETKEVTVYDFPIMGYKNKKAEGIVW